VFHSRCSECGSSFGRYPKVTDKNFKAIKKQFGNVRFGSHRKNFNIDIFCNVAKPNELDDELDKVFE
jgi:hypothetical protein